MINSLSLFYSLTALICVAKICMPIDFPVAAQGSAAADRK